MNYVDNGNMIHGFAILVYPAALGDFSMFMINQDGVLYHKAFTTEVESRLSSLTEFDPDTSWTPTE